MSLALFAMIQELKAEVMALTARVMVLEAKELLVQDLLKPTPTPKPNATRDALLDGVPPRVTLNLPTTVMGVSEPRPTLSLSKPNKRA